MIELEVSVKLIEICITRWKEGDSYFEDYKVIEKEIPREIALKLVENGDARIIEVEDQDDSEGL